MIKRVFFIPFLFICSLVYAIGTPTHLTGAATKAAASFITTSTIDPTDHAALLVSCFSVKSPPASTNTLSDSFSDTLTYEALENPSGAGRLTIFLVTGYHTGTGTFTCTFSSATIAQALIVDEITSYNPFDIGIESQTGTGTSSTASLTFSDFATRNIFWGSIADQNNTGSISPGSGETELAEYATGGCNPCAIIQTQYGEDTTFNWSGLASVNQWYNAWEIKTRRVYTENFLDDASYVEYYLAEGRIEDQFNYKFIEERKDE